MSSGPNGGVLCWVFETLEAAQTALNIVRENTNNNWDDIRFRFFDGKPYFQAPDTKRPQDGEGTTGWTLEEFDIYTWRDQNEV